MSTFNIGSVSGGNNAFGDRAQVRATSSDTSPPADQERSGHAAEQDSVPRPIPARAAVTPADGPLRPAEIAAVANCYPTANQATAFLRRAGMDTRTLPLFSGPSDALDFWTAVSAELGNGAVVGGRQRLLATARAEFPAQPAFRDGG